MNLTLRSRIFIIISLVIFLILAISISLIVFSNKKEAQNPDVVENGQNTEGQNTNQQIEIPVNVPTVIPSGATIIPQTQEESLKSACLNLAKVYVERFGSYSTDNPGKNLQDLEVLSTVDLWKVLKNRMDNLQTGDEFFSVVTRAIGASFESYSKEKSTVTVLVVKDENKNGELKKYEQEAVLIMVGDGNSWLVDDVKWK